MARGLLGMTAQGEKAYGYPQPGDDIVVGFFDDVARYLAVIRSKGPMTGFSPAEMSSILRRRKSSASTPVQIICADKSMQRIPKKNKGLPPM